MRIIAFVLCAAGLAGCACKAIPPQGLSVPWTHPTKSKEAYDADNQKCMADAKTVQDRINWERTRGTDQSSAVPSAPGGYVPGTLAGPNTPAYIDCMRGMGWSQHL